MLFLPGEGKNWQKENFAGNYMLRLAEINLDFATLLQLGVPGLRTRVAGTRTQAPAGSEDAVYAGMLQTLDLFAEVALTPRKRAIWPEGLLLNP